MRVGLDLRPLTMAPFSGHGRQVLALYNTLRIRPDTEVMPLTGGPHTHLHRTWAFCPSRPCPVEDLWQPLERWRFERRFLPEALSGLAVDVHIATASMGLPLGLNDVRRKRTKWVLQLHDLFALTMPARRPRGWQDLLSRWFDAYSVKHALALADAIWVPSGYVAQSVAQRFPEVQPRVQVLPAVVPFEPWQRLNNEVYTPQRYWLLVGTHARRKNVNWFVQAWLKARELWPDVVPQLVIIGHPRDLKTLPQQVRFVHGIPDGQLANWYRQAERVWHPAYAEGFGLPVIEAAACGVPVATALGTALDETTPPGALRFDARDAAALVQLMYTAATQPRGQQETAEALQGWARRYDLPAYASRVDALLGMLA
jgi:polysaccharide biosynthesis protein PslI